MMTILPLNHYFNTEQNPLKKDSPEILEMTAKVANDGIETLQTKQLVAIINEAKTIVQTYFVKVMLNNL